MTNPIRGEITAELGGKTWNLCLTLGALASLETHFQTGGLAGLSERFSSGTFSANDLIKIITAGLNGSGNSITEQEVASMSCENGLAGFVEIVTRLLSATFAPANHD